MKTLKQQVELVASLWKELNSLNVTYRVTKKFLEEDAKKQQKESISKEDRELLDRIGHRKSQVEARLRVQFKKEFD